MKKIESITFRTDSSIKNALLTISGEKKWSLSQVTDEVIKEWLMEKRPDLLEEIRAQQEQ